MYPTSAKQNHYFSNRKDSTVYTPADVAEQLCDIVCRSSLWPTTTGPYIVEDIGCGNWGLSAPFHRRGWKIIGFDKKRPKEGLQDAYFVAGDFFEIPKKASDLCKDAEIIELRRSRKVPDLVISNPPFNHEGFGKRTLIPEVWLKRIFDLYGTNQPTMIVVPMGFRLNQKRGSARYQWLQRSGAKITSVISLPIDAFDKVLFHAEVLLFNVPGVEGHYFLNFGGT